MRCSYRKFCHFNQKIALILGMATLLYGCSKFSSSSNSEDTQDPAAQDIQPEAPANDEAEKPAEPSVRAFKVTEQPEEEALDGKSFTNQDNPFLSYIPANAVLAFATTRQVPEEDILSYMAKKKNLQNALGVNAAKDLGNNFDLSSLGSDRVVYIADDTLVSVIGIKDASAVREELSTVFESIKLMLSMQGLELDGEPTAQKNVTTYHFNLREDPKRGLIVTTNILSDKMIITVSEAHNKAKVDKYYQSQKASLSAEKLGKIIPERTFASLYILNDSLPDVMKLADYLPMYTSMLGIVNPSMDRICTADYKWLLSAFPETRLNFDFYNKTLEITGDVTVREDIRGKLSNLTTKGKRFNMPEHIADMGIQFNLKGFYETMKEFSSALERRPLTCPSLKDFNQFASDIPFLFESEEASVLLDLTGLSFSITDSEMKDEKMYISYAGHVHTTNAEQALPTLMRLAGKRKVDSSSFVKGKAIKTPFPIDLPGVTLPEGNAMITNDGYYIASENYDVSKVAIVAVSSTTPWIDIHVSSKLSTMMTDMAAQAELLHIEHAKKMHDMDPNYPFDEKLYEQQLKKFEEKRKNPDPIGFEHINFTLGVLDEQIHLDLKITD
ncbi:MAG: hypothetical protein IJU23_14940 [Proteobacteria bacterium]|nr:hypothetical protein [Pseudomonadota bacterium]